MTVRGGRGGDDDVGAEVGKKNRPYMLKVGNVNDDDEDDFSK